MRKQQKLITVVALVLIMPLALFGLWLAYF